MTRAWELQHLVQLPCQQPCLDPGYTILVSITFCMLKTHNIFLDFELADLLGGKFLPKIGRLMSAEMMESSLLIYPIRRVYGCMKRRRPVAYRIFGEFLCLNCYFVKKNTMYLQSNLSSSFSFHQILGGVMITVSHMSPCHRPSRLQSAQGLLRLDLGLDCGILVNTCTIIYETLLKSFQLYFSGD